MESINQIYYDLINNYQAIVAAIIGVFSAIIVSLFQYITTNIIKEKEKKDFENAVVSAIYEELIGLYNCYNKDFQTAILDIPDNEYMITTFTVTQDFFTIYHNNASNIGKIKNHEIRNSIVQIYILLKKLIENILYFNSYYTSFMKRRKDFICENHSTLRENIFNGLYVTDCYFCTFVSNLLGISQYGGNYKDRINILIPTIQASNNDISELLILVSNDNVTRDHLIKQTKDLKRDYTDIRNKIIEIIDIIKKEYNIISDTTIDENIIENVSKIPQNIVPKEMEQVNN